MLDCIPAIYLRITAEMVRKGCVLCLDSLVFQRQAREEDFMKRVKMIAIFIAGVIFLTGCQTTPEKSSVAGKADGLNQEVTAEPLKEGETVRVALPDRWKDSEKRSNDRVILSADLTLDEITVGNLPVIEMENRALTDQELEHMVRYFAGEDTFGRQYLLRGD